MPYKRPYKTTSKARASRKPPSSRYKSKGGGLNKVEKKQTMQIAKKTVLSMAESKYFDCISMSTLNVDATDGSAAGRLTAPSGTFANPNYRVRVFGYSTTNIIVGDTLIDQYEYGIASAAANFPVLNLNMAKRATSSTDEQRMEGSYCMPSMSKLELSFRRASDNLSTRNEDEAISSFQNKSPIKVRVIVATPRTSSGKNAHYTQEFNPQDDLFVNEKGDRTGITDGLSIYEIEYFKTNGRKYKVSMDKTFTLNAPNAFSNEAPTQSLGNGVFEKKMVFNFDIGKKLYYKETANSLPTAGANNSFVLVHAWFPTLENVNNSQFSMPDLRIGGKCVSTFKDI